MRRMLTTILASTALLAAATGCVPTVDVHGNMPEQDVLDEIQPGIATRETVSEKLGTPSTIAMFEGETWYYVGRKTQTTSFFNPKTLDQRVIVVRFDGRGRVDAVDTINGDAARPVQIVERETPTRGREYTFVEQLLGNIGRFNNSGRGRGGGDPQF
ncbi:MAG: outer membrane protein assembly factor BamE [Alphaproteobacteria bacterium]|nr:outer membrane protein assembly factor BamE [Alphaproteobacteria bacterium]